MGCICIAFPVFQLLLSTTTQSVFLPHKSTFTQSHTHTHTNDRWLLFKKPTCLSGTHTHTFTHQWQPSGAIWGSVSCQRTLRHVDRRSRGFWLVDDPLYPLSHSRPTAAQWAVHFSLEPQRVSWSFWIWKLDVITSGMLCVSCIVFYLIFSISLFQLCITLVQWNRLHFKCTVYVYDSCQL